MNRLFCWKGHTSKVGIILIRLVVDLVEVGYRNVLNRTSLCQDHRVPISEWHISGIHHTRYQVASVVK